MVDNLKYRGDILVLLKLNVDTVNLISIGNNLDLYADVSVLISSGGPGIDLAGTNICFKDTLEDTYGICMPSRTGLTANKTLATTDQIPTIPTKVSKFSNDAGYITASSLSGYATTSQLSEKQDAATAYNTSNIVYSSTEPQSPVAGMIWLKPVQ